MTPRFRIATLILTLVLIVTGGTIFFHWVEGWSWLDAYFFTVVTLSTVGYGNLVPMTALGKVGTTLLIFVGLGVFAVAVQQFGQFAMRKREEHTEWLVARFQEPQDTANTDDDPETDVGSPQAGDR
ncbi:potassium channel family protein [Marivita sp. XM-24bin2]|jgi:voltage-gated potassium channel|uniref:potassium channel family protein n=1 Tax=unclassified Marivita TaxID=2632480 RepID=UPI000D7B90C2|nr:potassium channel family protein [Marivita sp. XM-24bin2]MCR9107916.1 potassium channel family protein [Paracoccaceae bacterium]PWL33758.1 MAG: two pore domain potassium channel family protein [Marivita sp. XM-24bin2]